MKPTIQMHLRGHPELFWRRCGIWNRFRKFCVCRPTIKKRHWHFKKIGFLKKLTKLHQITRNQLFRCTYGVILSCFECAVAFGIDFENFAFAGQLSKNVTGTLKKNWFSQEIHKIRPDNMKPTIQMHLRGHLELFWRCCGIWNRFQKFCVCRPTIKNVTGTCKKNWFSEEIHKITPDNMKPTGQMYLVTIYFNKKSLLGAITPWELTQSWLSLPVHTRAWSWSMWARQPVEHHMAYTRTWS